MLSLNPSIRIVLVFFCNDWTLSCSFIASPRATFNKSSADSPIASAIALLSMTFIDCISPNEPTDFCISWVNPNISPSSAFLLAVSRFMFLPVNTCASNCAVIWDSKSNSLSATPNTALKLVPTFAASTAASANPSAPLILNSANLEAFCAMSSITLAVETFAAAARPAAISEKLVAASIDIPVKSINDLFILTMFSPLVPKFWANIDISCEAETDIIDKSPNSALVAFIVSFKSAESNPISFIEASAFIILNLISSACCALTFNSLPKSLAPATKNLNIAAIAVIAIRIAPIGFNDVTKLKILWSTVFFLIPSPASTFGATIASANWSPKSSSPNIFGIAPPIKGIDSICCWILSPSFFASSWLAVYSAVILFCNSNSSFESVFISDFKSYFLVSSLYSFSDALYLFVSSWSRAFPVSNSSFRAFTRLIICLYVALLSSNAIGVLN